MIHRYFLPITITGIIPAAVQIKKYSRIVIITFNMIIEVKYYKGSVITYKLQGGVSIRYREKASEKL